VEWQKQNNARMKNELLIILIEFLKSPYLDSRLIIIEILNRFSFTTQLIMTWTNFVFNQSEVMLNITMDIVANILFYFY
jgi:hypothetical protein